MSIINWKNRGLILTMWYMAMIFPIIVQAEAGRGSLSITANDTIDPISISSTDWLDLKISAFPERYTGMNADWWLYAETLGGRFYYDVSQGWVKNWGKVAYQGELFDLSEYNVFSGNGLPDGAYKIFFGVDIEMDGLKGRDWVFRTAKVNVSSVNVAEEIIWQNNVVTNIMNDIYLWNTEIPSVDFSRYASPEQLLSHLMYDQRDKWSYILNIEQAENLFKEGKFIGLGFSMQLDASNAIGIISRVLDDSPAVNAGITRGYKILSINGKSKAEIDSASLLDEIFGKDELGVQVSLRVQDLQGIERDITLVKDWVTLKSVERFFISESDENPGKKIGYLLFSTFIEPSFQELQNAFSHFKQGGVTDLVLDLRYNGGGRADVATYLASLIKGDFQQGQVFYYFQHNSNRWFMDSAEYFSEQAESLSLKKVVVITTSASCSASELIINGLRPYIDVVLIGEQTCGKPVGMEPVLFGDKIIFAVSLRAINVLGESDYYAGLPVTCLAEDEFTEQLGSPEEESYQEALHFINRGECSSKRIRLAKKPNITRDRGLRGFRAEVGAY